MAIGPIAGVAYIKVNGVQFQLRGSLEVQPAPVENESIIGMDGPHGFKQKPVEQYIKGEFSDSGGLSLQALQAAAGVTVTAELVNGKTYILTNGFFVGQPTLAAEDGKIPFKFAPAAGGTCREQLA